MTETTLDTAPDLPQTLRKEHAPAANADTGRREISEAG